jgi:hypothetical protein
MWTLTHRAVTQSDSAGAISASIGDRDVDWHLSSCLPE